MNLISKRGIKCGLLLQTASFLALANAGAAQAADQTAANDVTEQVLVTGSLIHGAEAVGYPLVGISDQDFKESGGVTISDVLKDVPSVSVQVSNSINESGGQILHNTNAAIHGISSGTASETLLMIDGIRFPPQGVGFCVVDPSIVPTLAVDHVDVLADGASAVYGSDAVAGVINVQLKRGFDGAISQVQWGRSTDIGGDTFEAQQLYGTKWANGDVTVAYQWSHTDNVPGPGRPYFTTNFEPFGFADLTPIGDSIPGIVSTGSLAPTPGIGSGFSTKQGTRDCSNCYSVPLGVGANFNPAVAPVPTTTWTALLANKGVLNEINPAAFADVLPSQDLNQGSITFDQEVMHGVQFFGEAFYSNRRSQEKYTPGASPDSGESITAVPVPTLNPYYPIGAPNGLQVSYSLGIEDNAFINSQEAAYHYEGGFNIDLPYDWHAKIYYAYSQDNASAHARNMVNANMITAALGGTVGALPGPAPNLQPQASFTKPSNVPYLNLFCDATKFTCNSPVTLAYISAFRDYDNHWAIGETGVNFDGKVFDLPGGPVRAAVGFGYFSDHTDHQEHSNFGTNNTSAELVLLDPATYNSWDSYIQVDIPFVGEANKFMFVQALDVQVSGRYDHYNTFGPVWTPKVDADWTIGWGLKAFGGYGTSFRAPIPAEVSVVNGALDQPQNLAAGDTVDSDLKVNCGGHAGSSNAVSGSLDFILNPNCNQGTGGGLQSSDPGGISLSGGSGAAQFVRSSISVQPERAQSFNLGAEFKPTDFLSGLDLQATWYNLRINGSIANNGTGIVGGGIAGDNDPRAKVCTSPGVGCVFFVRADVTQPITAPVNAVFLNMVTNAIEGPRSVVPLSNITNIQWIEDTAVTNTGFQQVSGLDFNGRYDFDLGNLGSWNVGVTGTYLLMDKSRSEPGLATINAFHNADSGGRMSYRGRVGWDDGSGLSVTAFVNHYPHSENVVSGANVPPPCYWAAGFGPGSCYPGSPYTFAGPVFKSFMPGLYTFDLSIGYQTGTKPSNPYLQNVNFQFVVNDLFDKAPPFEISNSSGRSSAAFVSAPFPVGGGTGGGGAIGPMQRTISFGITKAW